jgi:AraC family transcriptional regulator
MTPEHSEIAAAPLDIVLTELLNAVQNALEDDRESAHACLERAGKLLKSRDAELLSTGPAAPRVDVRQSLKGGLAPWQVRRVMAHVDENLSSALQVKDIAALVRLSPFHFSRAFRISVGSSTHEYIIRRRIERAQDLMLSTPGCLSQIAADCGLADQSHLTKLFRKLTGESPAAWRRARISPDEPATRTAPLSMGRMASSNRSAAQPLFR